MSYDGSGNYTVPAGTAAVSGTIIDSVKYNALLTDLQTALTKCLLRDGQSAALANISMGGFSLTGLAAAAANGQAVRYEQVGTLALAQGCANDGANTDITSVGAVTGVTATAKDATTLLATTAFVDRLRSLLTSATSGTLVLADRGCLVPLAAGITIPASIFAANDVVTLYNNTAGSLTITQGGGLTLRNVGTSSTGNRTLALRGLVTVLFISTSEAVISGGGLT